MQHLNAEPGAAMPACRGSPSGAKSKIGYAGKFVAEQAVQLHGGMGMTDELQRRPLFQADLLHQHPVRRSREFPCAALRAAGRSRISA